MSRQPVAASFAREGPVRTWVGVRAGDRLDKRGCEDQRQVADSGHGPVVRLGSILTTRPPQARATETTRSTSSSVATAPGTTTHGRSWNRSGEDAS